ncbi:MAG: hypothetical protein SOY94_01330 [Candidatus Limiplasma sp.]|nr:hypothetical protein [Candidatus Limiplasma sp.]
MRKITLEPVSCPKLEINGNVFELKMSDIDIMTMADEMRAKYAELAQQKASSTDVLNAAKEVAGCIDKVLGKGAVQKICKGKPVSIATAMKWLTQIAEAAMEEYASELERKNE